MNLTTAEAVVRQFARNGKDTTMYPQANVQRAILLVGNHFVRHTRCTRQTSTFTLTTDDEDFSLSALTGFRPELLMRAWIDTNSAAAKLDEPAMAVVDYDTLRDTRRTSGSTTATPELMAFTGLLAGEVFPTPDDGYTGKVTWSPPFTVIDPGVTVGSTTLNVPDDLIYEMLVLGATAFLQHTEPQHAYASASWQRYMEFMLNAKGRGNLGPKVVFRERGE